MTYEDRKALFCEMATVAGVDAEHADDWCFRLDQMGFFTAPASTKYHGAYEGGLFDHCCAVTKELANLTLNNGLRWMRQQSYFIVGMFHDLCKCDKYEHPVIGQKLSGGPLRDGTKWQSTNGSPWGDGHATKSVAIAGTLVQLTEEEAMCILHHMGAYEKDGWSNYDAAIRRYQTVLWTHHADMIASKVHGV